MSLVNSNKNKKMISRGPEIKPEKTFSIDQHKIEKETPFVYVPKPSTLKIDTKLRDQINTLANLGYGSTQKETLELLIDNVIEAMTPDEKRKFDFQYQVLEDKTIKSLNKASTK